MKRFLILPLLMTLFALPARADVFDRINQCEASGSQTCIFNILRELARQGGPGATTLVSGRYRSNSGTIVSVSAGANFIFLTYPTADDRANGRYDCSASHCVHDSGAGYYIDLQSSTSFTFGGQSAYVLIR